MIAQARSRKDWNKGKRFPPEPLSRDEVKALLATCSKRAPTGIRNRALITLLYRTGLRISEALDLKPKDIDHDKGTIRVLHGKGDRARTIGVDEGALAVLELWMQKRASLGFNGRHPIFCTLEGKRCSADYVRILFPRLAKKAGINKRCHPHGLRHTFASELRQEGTDVGEISLLLGHSSIATTARYLNHVHPKAAIETVRAREWSA